MGAVPNRGPSKHQRRVSNHTSNKTHKRTKDQACKGAAVIQHQGRKKCSRKAKKRTRLHFTGERIRKKGEETSDVPAVTRTRAKKLLGQLGKSAEVQGGREVQIFGKEGQESCRRSTHGGGEGLKTANLRILICAAPRHQRLRVEAWHSNRRKKKKRKRNKTKDE